MKNILGLWGSWIVLGVGIAASLVTAILLVRALVPGAHPASASPVPSPVASATPIPATTGVQQFTAAAPTDEPTQPAPQASLVPAVPADPPVALAIDGGMADARYATLGGAYRDFVAKFGAGTNVSAGAATFTQCPGSGSYEVYFDERGLATQIMGGSCSGAGTGWDWGHNAAAFFPPDAGAMLYADKDPQGEPYQYYESASSPVTVDHTQAVDVRSNALPSDVFTLSGSLDSTDAGINNWTLQYGGYGG